MKKTYGVCFGIIAMGLALVGAPAGRAQSRMAAGGSGGAGETSVASATSAPAASTPSDLDRRIDALETELLELRTELAAKKEADLSAASAVAASPAPAVPAQGPEKVSVASLLGPTSVSGFVDAYYQVNFNHPNGGFGSAGGGVPFRAYDFRDRTISLNMMELVLDKAPDPMSRIGYRVALGYGDGMNITNSFDPANGSSGTGPYGGGFAQNLKEAYMSYLAPVGKGLQVDVGKFATPMGAEVIESKDNWNYSRGMLFTWAIPLYHFGARAKYTLSDKYSVTGYLVNGWNNVVDSNSGKTYGFSFNGTPIKPFTFAINYLAGPEEPTGAYGPTLSSNKVWRQTWDAVATYTLNSKLAFMANFDYGRGDRVSPVLSVSPVYWTGLAGYVKYSPTDKDYLAGRYEYFEDHDGFATATGTPRIHFNTFTATYQRTLSNYLLARFEYRYDSSQFPVYPLSTFVNGIKHQNTATIGLIVLFDSRNAK